MKREAVTTSEKSSVFVGPPTPILAPSVPPPTPATSSNGLSTPPPLTSVANLPSPTSNGLGPLSPSSVGGANGCSPESREDPLPQPTPPGILTVIEKELQADTNPKELQADPNPTPPIPSPPSSTTETVPPSSVSEGRKESLIETNGVLDTQETIGQ